MSRFFTYTCDQKIAYASPKKSQTKIPELSEKIFSWTIFAHLDYIRNMRRIHNFEKNYAVSLIFVFKIEILFD